VALAASVGSEALVALGGLAAPLGSALALALESPVADSARWPETTSTLAGT